MASTASEIIALAQSTKALSTAQLQKILELAPKMTGTDLGNLKNMILAVRESELNKMKSELHVRKEVGARYQEWQSDRARDALNHQESASKTADEANAAYLLNTLNQ